jgi:hypothetical protein
VQIGGGVRVSDAFQSEAELVTHSNMRAVVLCLISRRSACVQRAPDKGNEMHADDAMMGNAGLVNVLKTTD